MSGKLELSLEASIVQGDAALIDFARRRMRNARNTFEVLLAEEQFRRTLENAAGSVAAISTSDLVQLTAIAALQHDQTLNEILLGFRKPQHAH